MLCRRVLSLPNRVVYFMRHYSLIGNSTDNRESRRTQVLSRLASEYGHKRFIENLFKKNPQFVQSDFSIWKDFISTLNHNGFELEECFKIVERFPPILGHPPEEIEKTLNAWRKIFVSDMLKTLIITVPEFLNVDPTSIKKRAPFLLSYCRSTESLVILLFLCPNIMYDSWDETLDKISFLNEEMIVDKIEIMQCKALSKPLRHIKLRFSVLVKCGVYTMPNPVLHKQTKKERYKLGNPVLKHITDTSNHLFARKVAKISLEEYKTFSNLFDNYENEDTDSESDLD